MTDGAQSRRDLIRLVRKHEKHIRQFFTRRVANDEDAEDLTQDAICAILKSYHRFRGDSSVWTWIFSICKHHLYSYYSRKDRSRRLLDKLRAEYREHDSSALYILDFCYDRLRPEQRILYRERYKFRRSIREIARELGLPEGTVKFRLYELRKDIAYMLNG